MPRNAPRDVGKGIRRVCDDKQERFRRDSDDPGNDVAINVGIGAEESQSARLIVAISVAPPLFSLAPAVITTIVASRRSAYFPATREVAGARKVPYWRSVTTPLARSKFRFTSTISRARTAQRHREYASRSDGARTNYTDLHQFQPLSGFKRSGTLRGSTSRDHLARH